MGSGTVRLLSGSVVSGRAEPARQHLECDVCSGIAQPVEQAAVNRKVRSSNLRPGANFKFEMGHLGQRICVSRRPYCNLTAINCGKPGLPKYDQTT